MKLTFGNFIKIATALGYAKLSDIVGGGFSGNAADLTGTTLAANVVNSSLTGLGVVATGTWQGTPIAPAYGGTGVNNGARTLTINTNSGSLTYSAGSLTLTVAGNASVSGTNTGDQTSVTGNAGTATALATPRTINGVAFDGTANITVAAAAGTLTGATLASGVAASSLTSLGTLTSLTVSAASGNSVTTNTISGSYGFVNVSTLAGTVKDGIINQRNTAGTDHALTYTSVGGASAGDPYMQFNISGVTDWTMGVDNSDSDCFVISASSALGTSNRIRLTTGAALLTLAGTFSIGGVSSAQVAAYDSSSATGSYSLWSSSGTTRGYIGHGSTLFTGGGASDFGVSSATGDLCFAASGSGAIVRARISGTSGAHGMKHGDSANTLYNTGYLEIPQNSQSAAYTLVLADAGKHLYHPSADTTARTWTIPANGSVAFPIGTTIDFLNDTSGGVITIAITTDTLVLAGAGTTGSRTLAASGWARAVKMTSTRWMITDMGGLT
jgi:hypothetical protein